MDRLNGLLIVTNTLAATRWQRTKARLFGKVVIGTDYHTGGYVEAYEYKGVLYIKSFQARGGS